MHPSLDIFGGKMKRYQIGDVIIRWKDGNFELESDEFTECFQARENEEDALVDEIIYETHFTDLEKSKKETLLQKNGLYELYDTAEGKFFIGQPAVLHLVCMQRIWKVGILFRVISILK